MLRTVLITALCLVCFASAAEEQRFWILGTFAQEANAEAERARLEQLLDIPPQVFFDEARLLYRVAISKEKASSLELRGVDAWSMAMDVPDSSSAIEPVVVTVEIVPEVVSEPVAAPITAVEVDEQPAALISPPGNTDFLEKESLTEYCTRVPDARLCQHPNARSLLDGKSRPGGSRTYGRDSCDQLVDVERRRRCLEKLQPELKS